MLLLGADRELYAPAAPTLDTRIAAEMVCCPDCLRRVGEWLRFANTSGRFPTDTLGPSARGGGGGTEPGGLGDASRRGREILEHRPHELRVAVNGFVAGVQLVAGETNDLTVTVGQPEPIGLIELFSEQNVCLAALDVESPPNGPVEQSTQATLSDRRRVELAVSFGGPWPTVRAVYRDPWLAAGSDPAADAADAADTESTARSAARWTEDDGHAPDPRSAAGSWPRGLGDRWLPDGWRRRWLAAPGGGRARLATATVLVLIGLLLAFGDASAVWAAVRDIGRDVLRALRIVRVVEPLPARPISFAPTFLPACSSIMVKAPPAASPWRTPSRARDAAEAAPRRAETPHIHVRTVPFMILSSRNNCASSVPDCQ